MLKHREINFTIDYFDKNKKKRGEEPCSITVHSEGQRVIRATSKIFETEIIRDVIYTVDINFNPIDCFIKIRQYDKFISSTYFSFTENCIYMNGINSKKIFISKNKKTKPIKSFISHAVAADVWHSANIIKNIDKGVQNITPIFSSSPLPNGASDSDIYQWDLKAKFIKLTEIETPAGIFVAEHIQYFEKDNSLWLEMWCTNDSDRIMLKMYYPVYNTFYILNNLDRN